MGLWSTPTHQITFADIDAFCREQHAEGLRLDYKVDYPKKDLVNLVCAFANTAGGMILLGIEANGVNKPVWLGQTRGFPMADAKGLEEKIIQACRDNIFPPIRPEVSTPIANPHLLDHVLAVVRIDVSADAPHATNDGRSVYIRTGNVNSPIDFAKVDRIQELLARRQKLEDRREALIEQARKRCLTKFRGRELDDPDIQVPIRWAAVIPYYPARPICTAAACYQWHPGFYGSEKRQRVPGGSFGIHQDRFAVNSPMVGCIDQSGLILAAQLCGESVEYLKLARESRQDRSDLYWIDFDHVRGLMKVTFDFAQTFYKKAATDWPGLLLLCAGIDDAARFKLTADRQAHTSDSPSIDACLRVQEMVNTESFLQNPTQFRDALAEQIAFGFDLDLHK